MGIAVCLTVRIALAGVTPEADSPRAGMEAVNVFPDFFTVMAMSVGIPDNRQTVSLKPLTTLTDWVTLTQGRVASRSTDNGKEQRQGQG